MVNWEYIREHYPKALKEYMSKNWTLEEFWNAYEVYVNVRIVEDKSGCELWDWKINSKLIMYSSVCYKTIYRNGKKISVLTFDDIIENKMNQIFEIIEKQIKNQNYLNN
tara:strand:- start:4969 stop:5295 length:327 start_codon:yes stop_codon:yes gene_type:complete